MMDKKEMNKKIWLMLVVVILILANIYFVSAVYKAQQQFNDYASSSAPPEYKGKPFPETEYILARNQELGRIIKDYNSGAGISKEVYDNAKAELLYINLKAIRYTAIGSGRNIFPLVPFDEVMNRGVDEFLKIIDGWDVDKGTLTTYIYPRLYNDYTYYYSEKTGLSTDLFKHINWLEKSVSGLKKSGINPTDEDIYNEIVKHLRENTKDDSAKLESKAKFLLRNYKAYNDFRMPLNLNQRIGDDTELGNLLEDKSVNTPDEIVGANEEYNRLLRDITDEDFGLLRSREVEYVKNYFELLQEIIPNSEGLSEEKIEAIINAELIKRMKPSESGKRLSRQRINDLKKSINEKLKNYYEFKRQLEVDEYIRKNFQSELKKLVQTNSPGFSEEQKDFITRYYIKGEPLGKMNKDIGDGSARVGIAARARVQKALSVNILGSEKELKEVLNINADILEQISSENGFVTARAIKKGMIRINGKLISVDKGSAVVIRYIQPIETPQIQLFPEIKTRKTNPKVIEFAGPDEAYDELSELLRESKINLAENQDKSLTITAREDIEIAGQKIKAGEKVVLNYKETPAPETPIASEIRPTTPPAGGVLSERTVCINPQTGNVQLPMQTAETKETLTTIKEEVARRITEKIKAKELEEATKKLIRNGKTEIIREGKIEGGEYAGKKFYVQKNLAGMQHLVILNEDGSMLTFGLVTDTNLRNRAISFIDASKENLELKTIGESITIIFENPIPQNPPLIDPKNPNIDMLIQKISLASLDRSFQNTLSKLNQLAVLNINNPNFFIKTSDGLFISREGIKLNSGEVLYLTYNKLGQQTGVKVIGESGIKGLLEMTLRRLPLLPP